MAKVLTVGPFYFQILRLERGTDLIHIADTQEVLYPYRMGKALVLRIGGIGFVAGIWVGAAEDEDLAMALAIKARPDQLFDDEGRLLDRFERQQMRKDVARSVTSLDEEWKIVDALGLLEDD